MYYYFVAAIKINLKKIHSISDTELFLQKLINKSSDEKFMMREVWIMSGSSLDCRAFYVCIIGANRPEFGGTLTIFDCLSHCPALPSVCHDFLKLI